MGLQDLVNSGVDLTSRSAVEIALNSDAAVEAAAETNVRDVPDPVNPDPGDEAEEEGELAAPEAETAELEVPTPTGEETPDPSAVRIAELEAELKAAREAGAQAETAKEKSVAAQERATILSELVDELGENHPIVKETRRRHAAEDASEQREAVQEQSTTAAKEEAAHATHIATVPYLKSLYDNKDDEGIAMAAAISDRIMADPKLKGSKAAQPFTAEHYREVEARLLVRFPQAKAQFYKSAATKSSSGKVTPITHSQIRGGTSPVPGAKKTLSRDEIFNAALSSPTTDLDQIISKLNAG